MTATRRRRPNRRTGPAACLPGTVVSLDSVRQRITLPPGLSPRQPGIVTPPPSDPCIAAKDRDAMAGFGRAATALLPARVLLLDARSCATAARDLLARGAGAQ